MKATCQNCRFFSPHTVKTAQGADGTCRLNPPVRIMFSTRTNKPEHWQFPIVYHHYFCSQFQL